MRQIQRKRVAAGTVAVWGLVGSLGLGAQVGEPISPPIERTGISTILAIDPEHFSLTLDQTDPDALFVADPALRAQIALLVVGDLVNVKYFDARVVRVAIGGGGGLPAGVRPGQSTAVRPLLLDGTVTAVDFFGRSITVVRTSGLELTLDVAHESLLLGVQVGDTVTLTVSRLHLTEVTRLP